MPTVAGLMLKLMLAMTEAQTNARPKWFSPGVASYCRTCAFWLTWRIADRERPIFLERHRELDNMLAVWQLPVSGRERVKQWGWNGGSASGQTKCTELRGVFEFCQNGLFWNGQQQLLSRSGYEAVNPTQVLTGKAQLKYDWPQSRSAAILFRIKYMCVNVFLISWSNWLINEAFIFK